MAWLQAFRDRLRASLWVLPAVFALGAGLLAWLLLALDRAAAEDPSRLPFAFGGTPDGARSVLSAIAQSMLTFTGLVFSITMLVLQLASSQLSPRVTRTFLRDRGNQAVLGLFVATFVFTLLVLREVRTPVDDDPGFVPATAVWVAFALLLGSVAAFVYYIDHIAHAIRASTVIGSIWRETVGVIDRLDAEPGWDEPPRLRPAHLVLKAPRAGVIVAVDEDALLGLAGRTPRAIELIPALGTFVPEGGPLARLHGSWDRGATDGVRRAVGISGERSFEQDPAFGFRQLVDIALRALSPGVNDPTTAVQALDRIHDLLRRLARQPLPAVRVRHRDGVWLLVPRRTWADFLALGIDEIARAGAGQAPVERRTREVLRDLLGVVPPEREASVRRRLGDGGGSTAGGSGAPGSGASGPTGRHR